MAGGREDVRRKTKDGKGRTLDVRRKTLKGQDVRRKTRDGVLACLLSYVSRPYAVFRLSSHVLPSPSPFPSSERNVNETDNRETRPGDLV